jgi:hypothetical protein
VRDFEALAPVRSGASSKVNLAPNPLLSRALLPPNSSLRGVMQWTRLAVPQPGIAPVIRVLRPLPQLIVTWGDEGVKATHGTVTATSQQLATAPHLAGQRADGAGDPRAAPRELTALVWSSPGGEFERALWAATQRRLVHGAGTSKVDDLVQARGTPTSPSPWLAGYVRSRTKSWRGSQSRPWTTLATPATPPKKRSGKLGGL